MGSYVLSKGSPGIPPWKHAVLPDPGFANICPFSPLRHVAATHLEFWFRFCPVAISRCLADGLWRKNDNNSARFRKAAVLSVFLRSLQPPDRTRGVAAPTTCRRFCSTTSTARTSGSRGTEPSPGGRRASARASLSVLGPLKSTKR